MMQKRLLEGGAAAGADVYRELGRTGLPIFPIGLGAMQLSMNNPPDEEDAMEVVRTALEAGMNFIDTANVYCTDHSGVGHNERLIAKALKLFGASQSVIVATKGGVDRARRKIDATPQFLRASCIDSLRALECEAITLYQLHSPDDQVPLEESLGELSRLKEEGKIIHIGICNVTLREFECARRSARIESVQNRCNPVNAEDYQDGFLDVCEAAGVSYIPHSVIGGKTASRSLVQHSAIADLAEKYGAGSHALIVAWHLSKSRRVIPIPGASRAESAHSSAMAAYLTLLPEDVRLLDGFHLPL
jgi:aryl-alcohol dehydrogenase-like predicted oxidoreductase